MTEQLVAKRRVYPNVPAVEAALNSQMNRVKRSIVGMMEDRQKSQQTVYTPESTMIQIVLDGIATRMCLKYKLDPKKFVLKCLQDELHRLAVEEDLTKGYCPHCGRGDQK